MAGEEDGGEDFGDGDVVLTIGVSAHAAFEGGAVGGEEREGVAGLEDVLEGVDGGPDGGGDEFVRSAGTGIEGELRGLRVRCFPGSLSGVGGEGGIDIADEDALAEIAAGGFAKLCGLGVGGVAGTGDVEAGDATVEPEAGYVGEVGGGDLGVEVEEDAEVAAAGLVDEVVEIVEGAEGGVDGLGVGGVGLDGGEEDGVDTEGLDVVEALGDAVERAAAGGAEVSGVYLVDDGVLPPKVDVHAGADPAGAGEGLRGGERSEG